MTAALAVQSPGVQQRLASELVAKVQDKIDGSIEFSSISLQAPGSFVVKDLLIKDDNPYTADEFGLGYAPADTILYAKEAGGTISARALFSGNSIRLGRVHIKGVSLNVVNEPSGAYVSNVSRLLKAKAEARRDTASVPLITIGRLLAEDVHFRLVNFRPRKTTYKGGINYADLDARAESISGGGFKYNDGYISAWCDGAHITEKSGVTLDILKGRCKVGPKGDTDIWDLHVNDGNSNLKVKHYAMYNSAPKAFKQYTHQVLMKVSIARGSILSSKTVTAFGSGALDGTDVQLDIDRLDAEGFVDDFKVSRLKFSAKDAGVEADLDASVTGITITPDLLVNAKLNKLAFTTGALSALIADAVPSSKINLKKIAPGQKIILDGNFKGRLSDLNASLGLKSGIGRASTAMSIRHLTDNSRNTLLSGTLSTKYLGIGKLTSRDFLGNLTADAGLSAELGNGSTKVRVDSLVIDKLGLFGYDYTGIAATGVYSDNAFDGKIICADPNLNFIFQGIFNTSPRTNNALYKFSANLGYADLAALNLDRRGGTSKVSGQITTNFMKIPHGDILGDMAVHDLILENDSGAKHIGDIYIGSHSSGSTSRAQIESSFLDAGYVGTRNISDIIKDIQAITTRRELPSLYSRKSKDTGSVNGRYDLTVAFHDSRDLFSFIRPGVYIADSTGIDLRMDGRGRLSASVKSPRLAYGANYLKGLDISLDNEGGSINATLLSEEIKIGKVALSDNALTAYANEDEFFTSFHYDNLAGVDNMGEIYLAGRLSRDKSDTLIINAKPLSSYVRFEQSQWDLAESDIRYRAGEAIFSNFLLSNGDQTIRIDGGIARDRTDTLTVAISDIDLNGLCAIFSKEVDVSGSGSGRIMLSSPLNGAANAFVNIGCDSLKVNGEDAGTVRFAAVWDKTAEHVNAYLRNTVGETDALNIRANYSMAGKAVDLSASMDSLKLALFSPFTAGMVNDLSGTISGKINAGGSLDSLILSGSGTRIENARMVVAYTGVPYTINGPFRIDSSGLFLENISVRDSENGLGVVNGGLLFGNFTKPGLDASMRLDRLKLMGSSNRSQGLYGDLYASGTVGLSGPLDALLVDADLTTDKPGSLHISLGGASSSGTGDLLTFTDHSETNTDPYELMLSEMLQNEQSSRRAGALNFEAKARIQATPDVEAVIELDGSGDNYLTARGNGLVSVDIAPSRSILDIGGDYNISNGRYHITIPGIVSKNFNINSGSSIKFAGDILDSELDIDATYQLRTDINKLLTTDASAVATRRLVNCGIGITDRLSSPKLSFSIDIPDLDPTTKTEVESALNTEDKVQKQFLSLVIAGSFLRDEQSGIVNNSTMVFSNVSELMSRQLSNLLSRMDIPLDLGVGYQQNSAGTDLYDVSLSTELFDNRVEVHGSLGNRMYTNTTNPNGDVVGDVDIDIKLDKPGQLRLNLFSHSTDEYTSYLDYSQRNGAGITYQKEFNKWKDLLRSIFRRRRKTSSEDLQDPRPAKSEEKKTISISADD